MTGLAIEPTGSTKFGPCDCCGDDSRTVAGLVRGEERAAYTVHWTVGKVQEHGAHFDLIVENSLAGSTPDGVAVSLEFRRTEGGPAFMVIDAKGRPLSNDPRASRSLARDEVIGTKLAESAFKIVDAIWLQDERIAEIRGDAA